MDCPECGERLEQCPGTQETRGDGIVVAVISGDALHHHDLATWSSGHRCPCCGCEWEYREVRGCVPCGVSKEEAWRKVTG